MIRTAVTLGVTVIDTSSVYGQGDSERQIGKAIRGSRDKTFIVTKAGLCFSKRATFLRPIKPLVRLIARISHKLKARPIDSVISSQRKGEMRSDWRPPALQASLRNSLKRLDLQWVDAFLLHNPPEAVVHDEKTWALLDEVVQLGLTKRYGVSTDSDVVLNVALQSSGLTIIQIPWRLLESLDSSTKLEIRRRGVIVIAREVIRDQPKLRALDAIRRSREDPLVTTTLIGTTSIAHLNELVAGLST